MPRAPRIHEPGGLYHLISRGVREQALFADETDYGRFMTDLGDNLLRTSHRLYAYVLMPNHFHLVLQAGTQPLSALMQPLLASHAMRFNSRHRRVGHVFQGRYRSIICEREAHLLELTRYLHLNPVRAGLCAAPEDYPWSSHRWYLEGGAPEWLLVTDALGMFGGSPLKAVDAYRRFMNDGLAMGHRKDLYASPRVRQQAATQALLRKAEQALTLLCEGLRLERTTLASGARGGGLSEARALAAYLLVNLIGISTRQGAILLGKDAATVSRAAQAGQHLAHQQPQFSRLLQHVTQHLGA